MAMLGLRQPQFSEDLAWLPAWLQHPPADPLCEHTTEPQTSSEQVMKNQEYLHGNVPEGEDGNFLLREEDRYNSCHLFLSGEDNSSMTSPPISANVLNFCLHLSAESNSQSTPSPFVDISQEVRHELRNVILSRQVETLTTPGEKPSQSKLEDTAGVARLLPLTSSSTTAENANPQSVTNRKDNKRTNEEKPSIRCLEVAEVHDAVELSIAASEALVIHELIKSESPSEALPAAAVLEVALWVKQARLEALEDSVHHKTEEIEDVDFLSDLSDSTMTNAFIDVGLFDLGSHDQCSGGSIISRVEDTPISENRCSFDDKSKHVDPGAQNVDSDDISIQKQSEEILDIDIGPRNLPVEYHYSEGQANPSDDPAFDLNAPCSASPINPILCQSVQDNSNVEGFHQMGKEVEFSKVGMTSFKLQVDVHSPPLDWDPLNEEGEGIHLVPDRFRSRWFGGWTEKEVRASVLMKPANPKSIPKLFVGETSFLSESADIAQDENSFMLKNDTSSKLASQSSIHFEGLWDKANEEILLSLGKSSNLSLEDPLCSVVPCSISLENDGSAIDQNRNHNDKEVYAENSSIPMLEGGKGDMMQGDSGLNVKSFHAEQQDVPIIDEEGSGDTTRRRLTSLKYYSRLVSSHGAFSKRVNLHCNNSFPVDCNWKLQSSGPKEDHFRSSGKSDSPGILPHTSGKNDSTELLPFTSMSKSTIRRDYGDNHATSVIGDPATSLRNEERNCDEPTNTGMLLQVHMPKERNSPLFLNQRTCHQLQAFEHFISDFSGEENSKGTVVPDTIVGIQQSKNPEMPEPVFDNAHDSRVQIRKRVRFSEVDILHPQNKKLPNIQTAHTTRSRARGFKSLKSSNPGLDSRTHKLKWHLTNCCINEKLIFQGMEFLLTGFSSHKEKEIEGLIRKYGGAILPDIPSPSNSRRKRSSNTNQRKLPIVLCSKKLQTTKFLYGCAVNAFMLKVDWLSSSVAAGSVLAPGKYMILSNEGDIRHNRIGKSIHLENHKYIFEKVGIMLQGKHKFCTKFAKICKHGGGQVFNTLQSLVQSLDTESISVGAIVAEDESRVSRHLRVCASEGKIPMMPASWIIDSLHLGKLLPVTEDKNSSPFALIKVQALPTSTEFSAEI